MNDQVTMPVKNLEDSPLRNIDAQNVQETESGFGDWGGNIPANGADENTLAAPTACWPDLDYLLLNMSLPPMPLTNLTIPQQDLSSLDSSVSHMQTESHGLQFIPDFAHAHSNHISGATQETPLDYSNQILGASHNITHGRFDIGFDYARPMAGSRPGSHAVSGFRGILHGLPEERRIGSIAGTVAVPQPNFLWQSFEINAPYIGLDRSTSSVFATTATEGERHWGGAASAPNLRPMAPTPDERQRWLPVRNPFLGREPEAARGRRNHPQRLIPVRAHGNVDGYIKVSVKGSQPANNGSASVTSFHNPPLPFHYTHSRKPCQSSGEQQSEEIMVLPPQFGTGMYLDSIDLKIWEFHYRAYCPGRTLFEHNYWSQDLLSIAAGSECARLALLSFTSSYMLDYYPDMEMRNRALSHYRRAVALLSESLACPTSYSVGEEDAVVSATIMLFSHDIINWEFRRPKSHPPLWLEGAQTARIILDRTDPGYHYWEVGNIQCNKARVGNANWVAYACICTEAVTPLSLEESGSGFWWLLQGSEIDSHEIQGVSGVSSQLLYRIHEITQLSALLQESRSNAIDHAMLGIEISLDGCWQWSELSQNGHSNLDDMLKSFQTDGDGKVTSAMAVTDLTAYAWVAASQIYFYCRLQRKSRAHPDVLKSVTDLCRCVDRLPCFGPLFTSQSPFFPVFILAAAACRAEDRRIAGGWFEGVLNGANCRSSVPPVWMSVKQMWTWIDEGIDESSSTENSQIRDRVPWWESLVAKLVEQNGVLCLV